MACGIAEWIAGIGIAISLVIAIDGLFRYSFFLKRLRIKHAIKWRDLGNPELLVVEGSDTDRATWVFRLNAYYRDLNDPELTKMGDRIRTFGFINSAIVVVVGIVFVNQLEGHFSQLTCFFR